MKGAPKPDLSRSKLLSSVLGEHPFLGFLKDRRQQLLAGALERVEALQALRFDWLERRFEAYKAKPPKGKWAPKCDWAMARRILGKLETAYELIQMEPEAVYQVGNVKMFHQKVVPLNPEGPFMGLDDPEKQRRAYDCESVMRLVDDDGSLIQIGTIIGVLEATGKAEEIVRLDELGTRMQLNQLNCIPEMRAIQNVTGYALLEPERVERLFGVCEEYRPEVCKRLTLELDESWVEMVVNPEGLLSREDVVHFIQRAQGMGMNIDLDVNLDDMTIDRIWKMLGIFGCPRPEEVTPEHTGYMFASLASHLGVSGVKLEVFPRGKLMSNLEALEKGGSTKELDDLAKMAAGMEMFKEAMPYLKHPRKVIEKIPPLGMEHMAKIAAGVRGQERGYAVFDAAQWLVEDDPAVEREANFKSAEEMAKEMVGERVPVRVVPDYLSVGLQMGAKRRPAMILDNVLDYPG